MRVAELCPSCASYINANCIIYNGEELFVIDTEPLTSLDEILANINEAIKSLSGAGAPTGMVPLYLGQQYLDTTVDPPEVYFGLSTSIPNWGKVVLATTTTTTSEAPTTTTTTTA